jgi:tripartite ATP-independent transporter DctM subunit
MTIFLLFIVFLFFLLFLGVPIAFGMIGTALLILVGLRGIENVPFDMIAQRMVYGVNNFALLAIPAFLLIGKMMNSSGITDRIFNMARSVVGHYKGGLGHVNVVANMIMAGMSGSAVADAGGLGPIEIKAMTDDGYPVEFCAALGAAAATMGPVIPPSIPAVVYGALAGESIGKILVGSLIPGILMGIGLMIYVSIISHIRHYPIKTKASFKEFLISMKRGFLPLFIPIIIIGGIYTGIFTATESSAVALLYCVVISFAIYKSITLRELVRVIKETMIDTAVILFIIGGSSVYSWVLARYQVTHDFIAWVSTNVHSPSILLIYINLFLLLIGCFIDCVPALFLLTPLLLPLVKQFGIDPIQFGVVMIVNLMIGLITPPVGTVLYTIQRVGNIPFGKLARAVVPFYIPLALVLVLITYFPQIVLFLPSLMFR